MTGISMPEALIACVAMICITVFLTAVTLKGMDYKKKE
jgi:Tfp pilus assembly protein PilV